MRPSSLLILPALFCAPLAPAQGYRCTLLGTQDLHPPYCGVTGYVSASGSEFALLAAQGGTAVVDCTQPASPVEVAFFPWAPSPVRRVAVLGDHAYVVTGAGAGMQVLDLSNPSAPVSIGVVGASVFTGAANLAVDSARRRIYCVGTNVGVVGFDAASSPGSPALLGTWLDGSSANFVSDLALWNDLGYAVFPNRGTVESFDFASFPPTQLSAFSPPLGAPSRVAPDAGGALAAVVEPVPFGTAHLYDVRNPLAPVLAGSLISPFGQTPWEVHLAGDVCHAAWTGAGYRAFDVHDPAAPVEIASYDTWSGPWAAGQGAVGCFPFLPSGNVFLADSQTGLYVLRPATPALEVFHAPLGAQAEERNPYPIRATVSAASVVRSAALYYRIGNLSQVTVPLLPTGALEYGAEIPATDAPETVRYHLVFSDGVVQRRLPPRGDYEFFVGTVRTVFADDFEQAAGWTHGASRGADEWQIGTPAGRYGISAGHGWRDPGSAFGGLAAAGLDLGGAGRDGAYGDLVSCWLASPAIPVAGAGRLHLRYRRWLSLGVGDTFRVLANQSVVAAEFQPIEDGEWVLVDHDIAAAAASSFSLTIRFELYSDGLGVAGGPHLDDVEVYWVSDQIPADHYGTGTPGSGSFVPALDLSGDWHIGTTAVISASNLLGGSFCVLMFSGFPADFPTNGIRALVEPSTMLPWPGHASGSGPGAGGATFAFLIPNQTALDGTDLYLQIVGFDPAGPQGVSASDGLHFRVCRY